MSPTGATWTYSSSLEPVRRPGPSRLRHTGCATGRAEWSLPVPVGFTRPSASHRPPAAARHQPSATRFASIGRPPPSVVRSSLRIVRSTPSTVHHPRCYWPSTARRSHITHPASGYSVTLISVKWVFSGDSGL